jgi:hypothetical protein
MCGSQTLTFFEDTSGRVVHWNAGHGCAPLQSGKQPPARPPSASAKVPATQAEPLGQ